MGLLADLVLNALTWLVGMAPERPLWLRRLVQAFWIFCSALVVVAGLYSLVSLIRAF